MAVPMGGKVVVVPSFCAVDVVTAEIKPFPGVPEPERPLADQPDKDVVELCEGLLADAQSGRLRAVAVAYVKTGEATGTAWALAQFQTHVVASAVAQLNYRYFAEAYEASRRRTETGTDEDPA